MTAEGLLIRLRACARRRDLPTLSDLTDSRGPVYMAAYRALDPTGYYSPPVNDTAKRRRKCVDAALAALKAGE